MNFIAVLWIAQMLLTGGLAIYCGTEGRFFLGVVNLGLFVFGLAMLTTILLQAPKS